MSLILALIACTAGTGADPEDSDPVIVDSDLPADDTDDSDPPPPPPCAPGVGAQRGANAYPDLQAALDEAIPGDVVDVCPGVHVGLHTWEGQGDLTVQGFTRDAADVTLDANHAGRALQLDGDGGTLTLRHLTFVHADGVANFQGALHVRFDPRRQRGGVVVEGCHFRDNVTAFDGAALFVDNASTVTLDHLLVHHNEVTSTGAPVTLLRPRDAVTITDSVLSNNTGAGLGALAIFHLEPHAVAFTATLLRNSFVDNAVSLLGSGAGATLSVASPGPHELYAADNTFAGNVVGFGPEREPYGYGGALFLSAPSFDGSLNAVLERNTFDANAGLTAHLAVNVRSTSAMSTIHVADSAFYRGDTVLPYDDDGQGAAIYFETSPFRAGWLGELTLERVDMGTGPTANLRRDFAYCELDIDGQVSGTLTTEGDVCP